MSFLQNFGNLIDAAQDTFRSSTKSNKPNPNLNFFQNYKNHLKYEEEYFRKALTKCNNPLISPERRMELYGDEVLRCLNIFEPLHDAHDYMDEIMGITVIPFFSVCFFIAGALYSFIEFIDALMEDPTNEDLARTRSVDDKNLSELNKGLLVMAIAFITGIFCFLKSAISLISRPIVTALHGGFKESEEPRFSSEQTPAQLFSSAFEGAAFSSM